MRPRYFAYNVTKQQHFETRTGHCGLRARHGFDISYITVASHKFCNLTCGALRLLQMLADALPPRTRLVVFALSVFGSLGSEAAAFVRWLHKRQSGKLPPTLLEAASWACPQLGPFVRQAVGVAVRRGLAHAVNATHVHVPPPPPPAAPVAVRPRLTPWMDAARAGGVVVRELQ